MSFMITFGFASMR